VIGFALSAALLCGLAAGSDQAVGSVRHLYEGGKWAETVEVWRVLPVSPPALDYYAGMALARLGRFDEARKALELGRRKDPADKRFSIELAGLAYQRRDFAAAKTDLKRALRLDPGDRYASDFLATLYFLEQNLDAALEYWNRIGKPEIEQIRMEPGPKVLPALLDQAFAVAPASVLELRELRATGASLDLMGIFPRYQFALAPLDGNEKFDLVFRSSERQGWADTKWQGLISTLRGAPYATIYPAWYNLGRSAVNVTSLVRFDPEKLRMFASLAMPVGGNPRLRWRLYLDGRKENWDLTRSLGRTSMLACPLRLSCTDGQAGIPILRLQKIEAGADIRGVIGDRWGWSGLVSFADRGFARAPVAGTLFTNGFSAKYRGQVDRVVLRAPEKRLTIHSLAFGEFGKLFAPRFGPYSRVGASLVAHWFPQARGDRYELSTSARTGRTFGPVPFDELFMLGLERDNDLPMGAHIGTRDGRKGSAPLGRNYFLWNSDFDRTIYDSVFLKVKLCPFLDSGKITDPSGFFGSNRWLWDAGARLSVSIFSTVTVVFSYGKDLRGSRNAFYATGLDR
jgi:tetratricopeptide (TPR) repeat protein